MKKIMSAIVTVIFALCLLTATAMTSSAAAIKKIANFKATATPTSVTLTWKKSNDATGYQVQQFKDGEWETIKTINKAKTKKLKVKRLTPKKNYKFRICAVKNGKKGAYKTVKVKTNVAKVTGLTIESAGVNSAKLTWKKVTGASGYEIQRLVSGKWKKIKTVKKTTSTTVANLPIAQTSTFRVRAFTTHMAKNHFGKFSAKQEFTVKMGEMSGVTVKSVTESSATVVWNKLAGVNGYQIQKFDGSKWVDVNSAIGKGVTQYTVTGLPSLATTQIRVRAYAVSAGKTYYNNWATVSGSTKMGLASGLSYSGLTATSVKLTWTAASGAKGYYIKNGSTTIATVYTNSATVTLSPGTNYTLTVVPFAGSVTGFATNAVTFTSAPGKTATPTASAVTDTAITVTWAKTAGATRYNLQYSKNGGAWTTVSVTNNSYTASKLSSNTNYNFRVCAVNKNGSTEQVGAYSDTRTVLTKLSALTGLTYSELTATSVKLSWKAVSGATEYIIKNGSAVLTTVKTTSAVLTLSPGTAYSITVTPKSSAQTGSASAAVIFTSGFIGGADRTLVWGNAPLAESYEVQYYNIATSEWETVITTTSTSFDVTSQENDGTGASLYRVVAYNGAGRVVYTSEGHAVADEGFAVSYVDNVLSLSWPAEAGAAQYKVVRYTQTTLKYEEILNSSVTQTSYTLAPGFIYTIEIYADSHPIANFAVETKEMDATDSSDVSVNGQLLYLAEAINRTKFDTSHDVSVNLKSTMTNSINYLDFGIQNLNAISAGIVNGFFGLAFNSTLSGTNYEISNGYIKCKDAAAINAFFGFMNSETEPGEDQMSQTEVNSEEVTKRFQRGYSFNNDDGFVFKKNFIQPSNGDDSLAYIYNAHIPSAWKNGFDSVTTTKTADGYRIEAVLKQETTPNYHNGLVSALSADDMDFGGENQVDSVVGQTKIIAETDSENRLKSYIIDAPYILDVKVELPLDLGSSGDGGDLAFLGNVVIEMNMDMTGSTKYEYTFTNND